MIHVVPKGAKVRWSHDTCSSRRKQRYAGLIIHVVPEGSKGRQIS